MIGVDLPGSPATFDLSGMPIADGSTVAARRLLRSGYTSAFAAEAVTVLRGLGAVAVLDLRSPRETSKLRPSLGPAHGFAYRHVTIGGDGVRPQPSTMASLADLYLVLVRDHGPALRTAVEEVVLARDGALLVHCQTGRDRTGLVVALALRLAGSADDDIIEAQRRVERSLVRPLAERRAAWVAKGRDGTYFDALNRDAADALRHAVTWIDTRYGDTVSYLRAHGAPDDIARRAVEALGSAPGSTDHGGCRHGPGTVSSAASVPVSAPDRARGREPRHSARRLHRHDVRTV